MDSIFMNLANTKNTESHVLILKLTNELDLRIGKKTIALSKLSIYYTWKNISSSYNNSKFNISAPTWNDKFDDQMKEIRVQHLKIVYHSLNA